MARTLDEVVVNVTAKLSVDRKTAEACLKMVEIYINANSDQYIEITKTENGEQEMKFKEWSVNDA